MWHINEGERQQEIRQIPGQNVRFLFVKHERPIEAQDADEIATVNTTETAGDHVISRALEVVFVRHEDLTLVA